VQIMKFIGTVRGLNNILHCWKASCDEWDTTKERRRTWWSRASVYRRSCI